MFHTFDYHHFVEPSPLAVACEKRGSLKPGDILRHEKGRKNL